MDATFTKSGPIRGRLRVPGDKSIAHRALLLGAMASGTSRISGLPSGGDVKSTAEALLRLGSEVAAGESWTVAGSGWNPPDRSEIDCGNSGTTMRLLIGALSGANGKHTLRGDKSLSRRPMQRVASPLQLMGARVDTNDGRPPVAVEGTLLKGIDYTLEVPSAQVKSAVLVAGLQAEGTTVVHDQSSTRDHTERLLALAGAPITSSDGTVTVEGAAGPPKIEAFEIRIPGDVSSAAYLIVAACLVEGSELTVEGVGLNPTRTGLFDTLRAMGADLTEEPHNEQYEPRGAVTVRASDFSAIEVDPSAVPRMIDELPLLALVATQASGTTVIRGAQELRVKESDRIASTVKALRVLGADVEELDDGLAVTGPTSLKGGLVESDGDHRIALTLAIAGLVANEPVKVAGWESADVSFPGFMDALLSVTT